MNETTTFPLPGHAGTLAARCWVHDHPRYVVLLCHGYGEHAGRYEYVATRLVADGAVVYAVDHTGHGLSEGERVLIEDFERVVDDFRLLDATARSDHPGLPVVLVGHSMGGMIAARYAQRYGSELAAVVLSGPVLGRWPALEAMLAAEQIPDAPIDPATLSRDPEVGRAYVDDPLVWHGPFKRPTVEALQHCLDTITAAGTVGDVPVLWLHGEDDGLVPLRGAAARAGRRSPARSRRRRSTPGRGTRSSTRPTATRFSTTSSISSTHGSRRAADEHPVAGAGTSALVRRRLPGRRPGRRGRRPGRRGRPPLAGRVRAVGGPLRRDRVAVRIRRRARAARARRRTAPSP